MGGREMNKYKQFLVEIKRIEENRLVFNVSNSQNELLTTFSLSLNAFRSLIREYFMVCESIPGDSLDRLLDRCGAIPWQSSAALVSPLTVVLGNQDFLSGLVAPLPIACGRHRVRLIYRA